MIEIIKNLFDYDITVDDAHCYLVHGKDATTCIKELVQKNFKFNCVVLKASGMMDNISELKDYKGELIYFEEGDASKFFVKRYPEFVMVFSESFEVDKIIDEWVCTCYERRIIYFVDMNNVELFTDALLSCKFDTSVCYDNVWSLVDCVIENSPDAPNHDTFVVVSKRCLSAK